MRARWIVLSTLFSLVLAGQALGGPAIFVGSKATPIERDAAQELQRYLFSVDRKLIPIEAGDALPSRAAGFVLGTPESLPEIGASWPFGLDVPKEEGYIHNSLTENGKRLLVIASPTAKGVQNGVYGLLEDWGFGFYLGGDTLPTEIPSVEKAIERGLSVSKSPAFAVRGSLPWYNFFNSPSTWELADHKAFVDQLVKMRCNFVGFHTYDFEPFAAYEFDGKLVGGEPLPNTSKPNWGTKPLKTTDFVGGTGQFFDQDLFGAASSLIENRDESMKSAKGLLRQALEYAKSRGLKTCLGFELHGDPTDLQVQARFEARLKQLLLDYPMLDYVWLWEPEAMGLNPGSEPNPRTTWFSETERAAEAFSDIPQLARRAEAVRLTLFGKYAYQVLKAYQFKARLVMSGWGGDEWLKCSDFFPGMDKVIPEDVTFSALDNIRVSPTVSKAYGALKPERQRWPIIWHEYDGDQWVPQPNLRETAGACRDALQKGCQGLLGIHWRTRDVEESATFCARFSWDTELTVEKFCLQRAENYFGKEKAEAMAQYLMRLQKLGYRWVGGPGQAECGMFSWSPGDPAKLSELATIDYELRKFTGQKPFIGIELIGEVGKLSKEITKTVVPFVPSETNPLNWIFETVVPEQPKTPVDDLLAYIEYVLMFDRANTVLVPGAGLEDYADQEEKDDAVKLIRDSKLADALQLYARRMKNKGELGVLATINAKAWADVRERAGLDEGQLDSLEALPDVYKKSPVLLVLPDRVIVAGTSDQSLKVTLKTRALGQKGFESTALAPMGKTTYALAFPESALKAKSIEYGIEVAGAKGLELKWPPDFPKHTATAGIYQPDAVATATPLSQSAPVSAVPIQASIQPERWTVQLTWAARSGEVYAVSRNGQVLGTTADGWFEDSTPPSNATASYAVEARNVNSGEKATSEVAVAVPELPLPQPPQEIRTASRGNRVILGWDCNERNAAKYKVERFDRANNKSGELVVEADSGHQMQISDPATPGEAYTYTVSAVAPDDRVGPPSRKVGIIASTEPLTPMLQLSFKDESFLAGLASLADKGLALGGKGWAQLPAQSEWDTGSDLTLSVWAKLDDVKGMPVLICKGAWQQAGYFVQILNGQVRFYLAGVDTLDAGQIEPGKWQHIVATFGSGEMRIYLNGQLAGRKSVTGHPRASNEPLLIGRYGLNDETYFVRGVMDDVRIYDVALTPGEVEGMYKETARE